MKYEMMKQAVLEKKINEKMKIKTTAMLEKKHGQTHETTHYYEKKKKWMRKRDQAMICLCVNFSTLIKYFFYC